MSEWKRLSMSQNRGHNVGNNLVTMNKLCRARQPTAQLHTVYEHLAIRTHTVFTCTSGVSLIKKLTK